MRVFVLIEILRWRRLDRLGAEHDPRHFGSRHQLRRSRIFEESVISVDEEKVNTVYLDPKGGLSWSTF